MNLVQFPKENLISLQLFWNHTYIGKPLFVPSCCLVVPSELFYKFSPVICWFHWTCTRFSIKNWKIKVGKGELQMFIKMKIKVLYKDSIVDRHILLHLLLFIYGKYTFIYVNSWKYMANIHSLALPWTSLTRTNFQ